MTSAPVSALKGSTTCLMMFSPSGPDQNCTCSVFPAHFLPACARAVLGVAATVAAREAAAIPAVARKSLLEVVCVAFLIGSPLRACDDGLGSKVASPPLRSAPRRHQTAASRKVRAR